VDAIAELYNSLSAVCSNHGEHAAARASVGEVGNTPPRLTVDGDCYSVCVAHDEPLRFADACLFSVRGRNMIVAGG